METMSKKERVRAALAGREVDRVPVSMWGHDFLREWSPEDLAAQTAEAYRANDWDFVKLNPRWTFFAEAWGNEYDRPTEQVRPQLTSKVVNSAQDLAKIEPVDGVSGVFGDHITALKLLLDDVGDEVDVVYTLFSPLAVVGLLCGGVGRPLTDYAEEDPAALHSAIAAATQTLAQHGEAALEAGAAGVFFAPLQWASQGACSKDFYREFGRPYDLQVLQRLRDADFNMLHVCGNENMLELLLDYPVPALNWADQGRDNLSLAEARSLTDKTLIGGVTHDRMLELSVGEVGAQVRTALAVGATNLMVAGGCGIPPLTSAETKHAVVAAVRGV